MGHYSDLVDEELLKDVLRRETYLIGMIKSGKYDEYINFCHSNNFETVQVPLGDLSLLIQIIKTRL